MWTLVLGSLAAWAGDDVDVICPEDGRAALVQAAEDVERSWLELDQPSFQNARSRLGRFAACVQAKLSAEDALALHRARGLIAYVDGDLDAAVRAFGAVHVLMPAWEPPEALVPREHPLWRVFEASVGPPEATPVVGFKQLPEHGWSVDGTVYPRPGDPTDAAGKPVGTYGLPSQRAFVLQVFDAHWRVSYTGYHLSTADIPVAAISLVNSRAEIRRRRQRDARIAGSVIGGALLAGGAVAFAYGWQERAQLDDPGFDPRKVERVQGQANLLGGLSYGLGGAGALALCLGWTVPW